MANLQARLDEVRRRTISSHWTGTTPHAEQWWSCYLCEWIWKDGDAENHGTSCPNVADDAAAERASRPPPSSFSTTLKGNLVSRLWQRFFRNGRYLQ